MKIYCLTLILIAVFCAASFAQTPETLNCPEISVLGPAGIIEPGEIAQFTATVKDKSWENYIYKWTVTGGNIIEEKGKEQIDLGTEFEEKGKYFIKILLTTEAAGQSLGATVEVKGLPQGCPTTASEIMVCTLLPHYSVVDEFSFSEPEIDRARLKVLANQAQNNPTSQIYIIEKFKKKTSAKVIWQKNQNTIDYLKSRGIERDFITLLNSFEKENLTQLILVPSGAKPPDCDDCVKIEAE